MFSLPCKTCLVRAACTQACNKINNHRIIINYLRIISVVPMIAAIVIIVVGEYLMTNTNFVEIVIPLFLFLLLMFGTTFTFTIIKENRLEKRVEYLMHMNSPFGKRGFKPGIRSVR